ncbi:MAG: ribonuclease HII [Pegethrix bostrychoides GSE-TBD4-15B]|uniref:Ribonuclease HII n=1 Tax=Pegethrix bostrychoides GSE-TBD4-15B TaxID=2839662 RepID=A0A951U8N7_9CYAN|nr:ribonuclease HII [Pegethrix bostrychoides GSE-TBD4-15B]
MECRKLIFEHLAESLSIEQVAGIDEVGRGALFGPVVAAAVILPQIAVLPLAEAGLTDSKRLKPLQRQVLATQIQALAIDCRIGVASVAEIDRLNILQAALLAMQRAIARLQPQPQLCLIDGNQRLPQLQIPQQTLVKGDQKSLVIAAASVVAKVWRDRLMIRLAKRYPGYGLEAHKGYGTAQHRQALQQLGVSRQHRLSFSPCQIDSLPNCNA